MSIVSGSHTAPRWEGWDSERWRLQGPCLWAVRWISGLLAWGAECGPSPSSEVLARAWEEAGPPLWSQQALRINS